ncbi:hypothetical protein KUC_2556 [Vreelandella boliviensis LC1]|uniref:Uncharacterized protein n=1 Tax=Vreelandella boliviensis LC1 TaxID=1072583 RepID=A0A7U9C0J3_9GAMM|nr:hypothetical protein KUC_2556 [Halomonas boliviensis LC1]
MHSITGGLVGGYSRVITVGTSSGTVLAVAAMVVILLGDGRRRYQHSGYYT